MGSMLICQSSKRKCPLHDVTNLAEDTHGRIGVFGRYHRHPKRLEDEYELPKADPLGSGYNGAVVLARNRITGSKFAVKYCRLNGKTKAKKKELMKEVEIYLSMDHPHIARLVDVYETSGTLSLVMECMEGGLLFDRVSKRKYFNETEAVHAAWQILLAVNYLHSNGVVHRDIKLENFLYESPNSDRLKLIDFGFSTVWDRSTKLDACCGTLAYAAPEVLLQSYTSQCDMWSVGVVVFVLLVGYMPFGDSGTRNLADAIKAGEYRIREDLWRRVSDFGYDFVRKLLVVDFESRLTPQQALEHKWIVERRRKSIRGSVSPMQKVDNTIVDSLVRFAEVSEFERACMMLMAWSLSVEERREVSDAFLQMDQSGTGMIGSDELQSVLRDRFQLEEVRVKQLVEALDANHDDKISYSEFLAAMMTSRIALHDRLLKTTFQRLDADGSGSISPQDMQQILGPSFQGVSSSRMLAEADVNRDGRIDYAEFIAQMTSSESRDAGVEEMQCVSKNESRV